MATLTRTAETLAEISLKPSKLKDLGTIANNTWQTLSQDGDELKLSAAFWATLIHVVLRIAQAERSAQQPGPPDEVAYRKRESAKTFFREAVGVTLGWGVIKSVDKVMKAQLLKLFSYDKQKPATTPLTKGIGQAINVLKGNLSNVPEGPVAITGEAHMVKVGTTHSLGLERWGRVVHALSANLVQQAQTMAHPTAAQFEAMGFKHLHTYLPVALGAALAIPISGWWLERTTLIHGEAMIDKLVDTTAKVKHYQPLAQLNNATPKAGTLGVQPLAQNKLTAVSPSPIKTPAPTPLYPNASPKAQQPPLNPALSQRLPSPMARL